MIQISPHYNKRDKTTSFILYILKILIGEDSFPCNQLIDVVKQLFPKISLYRDNFSNKIISLIVCFLKQMQADAKINTQIS